MDILKGIGVILLVAFVFLFAISIAPFIVVLTGFAVIILILFQLAVTLLAMPFGKDPFGWRAEMATENLPTYSSPTCGLEYSLCDGNCSSCWVANAYVNQQ